MSAEDLAIDVGIPVNTDEFDTFVSCVENILDHGCGYSSEVTSHIVERCETSELAIAKEVLRECRREHKSRIRPSRLKWWQTWQSAREGNDVPRWPKQRPASPRERPAFTKKKKRPMSPMFDRRRAASPRARPAFTKKKKRPMSPMFDKRRAASPPRHAYGRRPTSPRERPAFTKKKKRPMSPMFTKKSGYKPESPRKRTRSNKRQRYR